MQRLEVVVQAAVLKPACLGLYARAPTSHQHHSQRFVEGDAYLGSSWWVAAFMSTGCCAGVPIHDLVFLRPDAPTTDGPGHACKVFQAQYGVHRELVALKVGVSAAYEVGPVLRNKPCLALTLLFTSAQH